MTKVYARSTVEATAPQVWEVIRDFGGLDLWHSGVQTCTIEQGKAGDQVGAVRTITLTDGSQYREQLLGMSDRERSIVSSCESATVPLVDCVATLRVTSLDGGLSLVEWYATFQAADGVATQVIGGVGDHLAQAIFQVGIDDLKARFS